MSEIIFSICVDFDTHEVFLILRKAIKPGTPEHEIYFKLEPVNHFAPFRSGKINAEQVEMLKQFLNAPDNT